MEGGLAISRFTRALVGWLRRPQGEARPQGQEGVCDAACAPKQRVQGKVPAGRRVGGSRFLSLPAGPPLATHWLQGCCPADAAAAAAADGGGTPAVRSARGGGPAVVGSARPEWTSRLIQRPAHCPHGTASGGRRGGTKTPYWRYLRGRMPSLRRVESRRRVRRDGLANWGSVARQDRDHRIAATKGRRGRDFFVVVKPRDSVPCHGPAAGLPVGCRSGDGPLSWVPRPGSWLPFGVEVQRTWHVGFSLRHLLAHLLAHARARTDARTFAFGGAVTHTLSPTPHLPSSPAPPAMPSCPCQHPFPCHAMPSQPGPQAGGRHPLKTRARARPNGDDGAAPHGAHAQSISAGTEHGVVAGGRSMGTVSGVSPSTLSRSPPFLSCPLYKYL